MTSKNYLSMPAIIYGTAWKKERTTELVLTAFAAGFRGIDTACQPRHYAEALVGEALSQLAEQGVAREDYYLQTKYTPTSGQDPETTPYDPAASIESQVAQSFQVSLQNLNTSYLDALILHSPFPEFEHTLEAWQAMEKIQRQGGCNLLGISNCYQLELLQQLYQAAQFKPQIIQNRFYADTGYDIALRQWCIEKQIRYQSFWTLTANPEILKSKAVKALAAKYHQSPAQVLFNYLHQRQITPLTGTGRLEHMKMDLASFEVAYDEAELRTIDQLGLWKAPKA